MTRFLGLTGLTIALLGSTAALAQDTNYTAAKGGDNILGDAQYSIPKENTATYTESAQASAAPREVQPSSGYDRTNDRDSLQDFTGPYVGADIGYNIGSYDTNDPGGPDGDVGLDGFEGGLFAGYGYTHNMSWLGGYIGLEGGYEWSGAEGDLGGNEFAKDHAWVVSVRPGVAMHEDTLGYAVIGYSRAEFENNNDEETLDGLILGAGAEFSTRSPFKARIEYTYTGYEDADLGGVDFDGSENQIKLGGVFRF